MLSNQSHIEEEAERSGEIERRTYLEYIQNEYDDKLQRAQQLYATAAEKTANFEDITTEAIREDPRIVMILRFMMKPTISQMKFGALIGLRSTGDYEAFDKSEVRTPNPDTAKAIADFASENLSEEKAPWVFGEAESQEEAMEWSRLWVADKVAEQRAETNYRNARAAEQEQKTIEALKQAGYTQSKHTGLISSKENLPVGTYTDESRVVGEDTKKADVAFRPTEEYMVLVEDKSMGVAIDAYKRTSEVRDKANGWRAEFGDDVKVVAVIQGGLDGEGVQDLMNHVDVYFEHRLEEDFVTDTAKKLKQE